MAITFSVELPIVSDGSATNKDGKLQILGRFGEYSIKRDQLGHECGLVNGMGAVVEVVEAHGMYSLDTVLLGFCGLQCLECQQSFLQADSCVANRRYVGLFDYIDQASLTHGMLVEPYRDRVLAVYRPDQTEVDQILEDSGVLQALINAVELAPSINQGKPRSRRKV